MLAEAAPESETYDLINEIEQARIEQSTKYWENQKNADTDRIGFTFSLLRENLAKAREIMSQDEMAPTGGQYEKGSKSEINALRGLIEAKLRELEKVNHDPMCEALAQLRPNQQIWEDWDEEVARLGFGWIERDAINNPTNLRPTEKGEAVLSAYAAFVAEQQTKRAVAATTAATAAAATAAVVDKTL
jgi:hypothetical protein